MLPKGKSNEDATEPKQHDRLIQDQEKMLHLARVARMEVEEETVIEDIPAFDTLDDGWEKSILSTPQVELEIEEKEPKIMLSKPIITKALKALQIFSNFFKFYSS